MKVLLVASDARGHDLALRIKASPLCTDLYAAPGNPGIAQVAKCISCPEDDVSRLTVLAIDLKPDLVVIGAEAPLALGLGTRLRQRGIPVFGPTEFAALLESRKWWAKQFMNRYGIPTAQGLLADTDESIRRACAHFGFPKRDVVTKADGLAGGKGVYMIDSKSELERAIKELIVDKRFSQSAPPVVIEERLFGEEVSVLAISDGEHFGILPDACDYKRVGEGDVGPNTGGMGAHSPSGLLTLKLREEISRRVFEPAIAGMREWGHPFVGVLYAGLMLTKDGLKVLEFNVRFGDPECQVVLPRLGDDILEIMLRAATGDLQGWQPLVKSTRAACFVLASPGYPDKPLPAGLITGIDEAERIAGVRILHASTRKRGNALEGGNGRVLNVCATGSTMDIALRRAREAASCITFENGAVWRKDIGKRFPK